MLATVLVVAGIATVALVILVSRSGGLWMGMHRSIGTTCPDCSGMGSTEDDEVCPRCHGRRYIWSRP